MQTVIETTTGWMIRCRVCGWHEFPKVAKPNKTWTFDGNMERPTFKPSMNELVEFSKAVDPKLDRRCHFVVTAGHITYCGDCTHELRGQTFDLEPWDQARIDYYDSLITEETAIISRENKTGK